jgi:hypothetical protein
MFGNDEFVNMVCCNDDGYLCLLDNQLNKILDKHIFGMAEYCSEKYRICSASEFLVYYNHYGDIFKLNGQLETIDIIHQKDGINDIINYKDDLILTASKKLGFIINITEGKVIQEIEKEIENFFIFDNKILFSFENEIHEWDSTTNKSILLHSVNYNISEFMVHLDNYIILDTQKRLHDSRSSKEIDGTNGFFICNDLLGIYNDKQMKLLDNEIEH